MPNYQPLSQKKNSQRLIENANKSHGEHGQLASYATSCVFEQDVYKLVKPMERRQAFVRVAVRNFFEREDFRQQVENIPGAARTNAIKRQDEGKPLASKQIGITFDQDIHGALKALKGKKQGIIRKAVRTHCVEQGLISE